MRPKIIWVRKSSRVLPQFFVTAVFIRELPSRGKKSKMEEIGISVQSQVSLVFSPFCFDM